MVLIVCTLLFNIGICAYEGTLDGATFHKVPREEVSVNVAGFDDLQLDGLRISCLHGICG